MKRLTLPLIVLLLFLPFALSAQFFDDFEDGDFLANPVWCGDTALFTINSQKMLQLNAEAGGEAFLSSFHQVSDLDIEWRFDVKMTFSPSSSNFARIYLSLDSTADTAHLDNSFYLQLGEAGSQDVIELFYQENGQTYSVLRGTTPIASSFYLRVKVTKDRQNLWHVFTDGQLNGIYTEEGSGYAYYDPRHNQQLGILCVYTTSNKNKFFFDNIYMGPPVIDLTPPTVTHICATPDTPDQLTVTFSEAVNEEDATNPLNYRIVETTDVPALCEFTETGQRQVRLYFPHALEERHLYHLDIQNITDLSGNQLDSCTMSFLIYSIQRHEVVINEIMADPTPSVQLPECEYIELYNRLEFPITAEGWKLQVGNHVRELPPISIEAHEYAIITTATGGDALLPFCQAPIYCVSALGLTDEGMSLVLYNAADEVIHHVPYLRKWHRTPLKQEGGWSLEMIDPDNPCGGAGNWGSCESAAGGTPGTENSIAEENMDTEPPLVSKITTSDILHIIVWLNEPMTESPPNFSIDHSIEITQHEIHQPDFQHIAITLNSSIRTGVVYTLTTTDSICDCAGNHMMAGAAYRFGLPDDNAINKLILNEVLSNPFDDSDGDFIEIYNPTSSIVDLGNLLIGTGTGELPDNVVPAVAGGYQLFPDDYAAICKDRALTLSQYYTPYPQHIIENGNLPALPNDNGCIHFLNRNLQQFERFAYDKSMHHPQLISTDGVSLERIHFSGATQDAQNWTSASAHYGWATPGYGNSQHSDNDFEGVLLQVTPEQFTPDGDGVNDFLEIFCTFPTEGCRITLGIYNDSGLPIKELANNLYGGIAERFRWDGYTQDHRACGNGLYIVRLQYWDLTGKRKTRQKAVSLVRRL